MYLENTQNIEGLDNGKIGVGSLNKDYGLFGTLKQVHESNFDYLVPGNYRLVRYKDAPVEDYEQFNSISQYVADKYLIEDKNILIYWFGPVNPKPEEGSRKQVYAIAYRLDNGFFMIMKMNNHKFLYAFSTSLDVHPDFPTSRYKEVKEIINKVAKENGLKFNSKTNLFTPEFYSIEEKVDMSIFKEFEARIVEIEKQFEIPFHNPLTAL